MDEYVSKNDIIPLKELFDEMLCSVRKDIKKQGITFICNLVGSAKRNLVICHPTKGIDCDYQLVLQSNTRGLNASEIKKLFRLSFDRYRPTDFSPCEDSTSALTMRKKDAKHSKILYSFDIVILKNIDGVPEILRRNSEGKYIWNHLQYMADFHERFAMISNTEMWDELRKRYYRKKIRQMSGDDSRKSFQLLNEATNEVLQVFNMMKKSSLR